MRRGVMLRADFDHVFHIRHTRCGPGGPLCGFSLNPRLYSALRITVAPWISTEILLASTSAVRSSAFVI